MHAEIEIESEAIRLRPELSEVERLFASNGKAAQLMDWRPEYGGLEGFRRGLAETIAWFTKPTNLARYRAGQYSI
jgi:dTDP-glucose 4,6-dehydratase